jgi:hypothetical protein
LLASQAHTSTVSSVFQKDHK